MVLNCSSYESAYKSLQNILSAYNESLEEIIYEIKIYKVTNIEKYLDEKNVNFPSELNVIFFHFTKTLIPESFNKGLFPLHMSFYDILKSIHNVLNIDDDLNIWINSMKEKMSGMRIYTSFSRVNCDDGPNGLLIRAQGFHKKPGNVNYLNNPEIISDLHYSGLLSSNQLKMLSRYYKKVIVAFNVHYTESKYIKKYIIEAMKYLVDEEQMVSTNDQMCFWNRGKAIPAEDIYSIEVLD